MKFKFEATLEKSAPTAGPNCGSLKGNYAHTKRKETSCQDCIDAKTDYNKAWKLANKEKTKVARAKYTAKWRISNADKLRDASPR